MIDGTDESRSTAEGIGRRAMTADIKVAVTESLTGGALSSAMAAAEQASQWYRGGLIAYSAHVKNEVLGVAPGPVVTGECAEQMAAGVAELLHADLALSTTGVGGPGPEEGQEPGTVFIGWFLRGERGSRRYRFEGGPDEVVAQTVDAATELGVELLRRD